MNVYDTYFPRNFCGEYVDIKGNSSQLGMFMSVVLGIKPLMDDWIPTDRIAEFRKTCLRYKLKLREDVIFVNVLKDKLPANILGREFLTTTSAFAYPLSSGQEGQVHVFISKEEKFLRQGMWYPVIIKNRVIYQPRIDSLKYGYALGYPDCCIRYFRKYNNWLKYSYLYEAYLSTKGKPSFLCNPFLKDTSFSYIYHMPCSYSCVSTIKTAGRLRKEIKKREPQYVKITDNFLRRPFLVLYEKKCYCFEGVLKGNRVEYKDAIFLSSNTAANPYAQDLKNADCIKLEGRRLNFYKGNRLLKTVYHFSQGSFAPEYPFLIDFS